MLIGLWSSSFGFSLLAKVLVWATIITSSAYVPVEYQDLKDYYTSTITSMRSTQPLTNLNFTKIRRENIQFGRNINN